MENAVDQLQKLGFGQYEAQAYLALFQNGQMNGYELARVSGVPRANVYAVLKKLEERGAILRQETLEGTRYTAVDADEVLASMRKRYEESLEGASSTLNLLQTVENAEPVFTFNGYEAVVNHARSLVEKAEDRLLLAVWPEEARALAPSVEAAEQSGVNIQTLCLAGCPHNCGSCKGLIHRYRLAPESDQRWLVAIPDEQEIVAAEIHPSGEAQAVRSNQKMLVNLGSGYIRQGAALAEIVQALGDKMCQVLDPATSEALRNLSSAASNQSSLLNSIKNILSQK